MLAPDFWDDPDRANELNRERSGAEKVVNAFERMESSASDAEALIELGEEMGEEEVTEDLQRELEALERELDQMEFRRMLGGEQDGANAIVAINSGAGGTESQDWAEMLFRMYTRFFEKQGWAYDIVDRQDGETAGIKSVTMTVAGEYAYGYMKAETGVHRLVRISPFDSNARRQTSFASVHVTPEIDDSIEVEINDSDLRVDTYRASGAGGQHVNRTDSAVRITHLPTNVVVQCQKERSQHKNRDTAMKLLRARLYELELQKRREAADAANAEKSRVDFGSQIRSYVLHPYQMVKDLRTNHETSDTDAVLDGDLTPFIESWLLQQAGGEQAS